jgi:acyl dehydratase
LPETISIEEFGRLAGRDLEPSDWLEIDQARIDLFADATNDHQFIHTDPERAGQTPFGGTIAHGYLTLSLLSDLLGECWPIPERLQMGLNYGSDKVRYLAPVKVGQRVRAKGRISEIGEKRPGQWLVKTSVTVEIEGESTPALIAEILTMFIVATE